MAPNVTSTASTGDQRSQQTTSRMVEKYDAQGNLLAVIPENVPRRAKGMTPVALRTRALGRQRNRKAELYAELNAYNTTYGRLNDDICRTFDTLVKAVQTSSTMTLTALKTTFTHLTSAAKTLKLQYEYIRNETKHLRPAEVEAANKKFQRLETVVTMLYRFSTAGDFVQLWRDKWNAVQQVINHKSLTCPPPSTFHEPSESDSEPEEGIEEVPVHAHPHHTTPLPDGEEHVHPVRHPRSLTNPSNRDGDVVTITPKRVPVTRRADQDRARTGTPTPHEGQAVGLTFPGHSGGDGTANQPCALRRGSKAPRDRSPSRSSGSGGRCPRRRRDRRRRSGRSRSRRSRSYRSRSRRSSTTSSSGRSSRDSRSRSRTPRRTRRRSRNPSRDGDRRSKRPRSRSPARQEVTHSSPARHVERAPQTPDVSPVAAPQPPPHVVTLEQQPVNPPATADGPVQSQPSDALRRRSAEAKLRQGFVLASGEPLSTVHFRTPAPGLGRDTVPMGAKLPLNLSPAAPYEDLADALMGGTTKDRLLDLLQKTLKPLTPGAHTPAVAYPPGWNMCKLPDTFDRNKKSFRKYF